MARSFNGTSDQAAPAGALSTYITAAAGTASVWAYATAAGQTFATIDILPQLISDQGGYFGIAQGFSGGLDRMWGWCWDGAMQAVGSTYSLNVWTHWAWRLGGGVIKLYKNGVSQGSQASGLVQVLTNPPVLGRNYGVHYWPGNLAEVGVWNTALADGEILALSQGLLPGQVAPASLTAYWPLWGLHSPETDLRTIGVGRTLVLTGTALANHAPVMPFSSLFSNNYPQFDVAAPTVVRPRDIMIVRRLREPAYFD